MLWFYDNVWTAIVKWIGFSLFSTLNHGRFESWFNNSNKAKGKRKLEDDKTDQYPQSKKVRKYKQDSSIEELGSRFPIVMNEIMSQLNDETLVNLKSISYKMHKIVDQETNSWLRKLKKLISWDKNNETLTMTKLFWSSMLKSNTKLSHILPIKKL